MRVRKNIVHMRGAERYTQARLAFEPDVAKGLLEGFENSKKGASVSTLEKWQTYLRRIWRNCLDSASKMHLSI